MAASPLHRGPRGLRCDGAALARWNQVEATNQRRLMDDLAACLADQSRDPGAGPPRSSSAPSGVGLAHGSQLTQCATLEAGEGRVPPLDPLEARAPAEFAGGGAETQAGYSSGTGLTALGPVRAAVPVDQRLGRPPRWRARPQRHAGTGADGAAVGRTSNWVRGRRRPPARCFGRGAGSWGFEGGRSIPSPDRNVQYCVGWLSLRKAHQSRVSGRPRSCPRSTA